jgi:hypothetical protein
MNWLEHQAEYRAAINAASIRETAEILQNQ